MENGRAAQAKQSQALCPQQECGRRETEMRSPLVTKSRPNDRATFSAPRSTASSCRLRGAFRLGIVALVAHPVAAFSQAMTLGQVTPQTVAPSQVTPETLRPAAPGASGAPQISGGEPLQAPAGAERLSYIVGPVVLEGAFPELKSETRPLIQAVEQHRVTVAEIYKFANALEEAYARAGYVLVRVTVPDQKLSDHGPLRIVVVDGFIEKVQVDNVPERVRALVAERMASLVGRRHIKLDEIERRLLTAGAAPGLRL
jgi:hemolysin activation/secretion protein